MIISLDKSKTDTLRVLDLISVTQFWNYCSFIEAWNRWYDTQPLLKDELHDIMLRLLNERRITWDRSDSGVWTLL